MPHVTLGEAHGRLERRRCLAIGDPASLACIDPERRWPDLRSVVRLESTRRVDETVTVEARHYLSNLPADAALLARTIRDHWDIENRLHWVLDVAFREDDSRVRAGHAPENLAIIRHFALNLLRLDRSQKSGLATKRLRAAHVENRRDLLGTSTDVDYRDQQALLVCPGGQHCLVRTSGHARRPS